MTAPQLIFFCFFSSKKKRRRPFCAACRPLRQSRELAHDHIARVAELVGAGAETDEPIVLLHLNAALEGGAALEIRNIVEKFLAAVKAAFCKGVRAVLDRACDQLERVVARRRVQRHRRMRIVVVLLLVALERAEHRAALHVVAEYERVLLREQPRVAAVHEHRTVAVLLPRVQVLEVILVVRAVYHGIVDDGVLGAQPRAYVRVDRLEHGKIDLRCARCFRRRRFARRVCRGSGGCRRIVPRRLRLHLQQLLLERRIALVAL